MPVDGTAIGGTEIQAILSEELAALRQAITDNIRATGQWASGATADSMQVVTTGASGELTGWAKQGVLLLNTTLTVREGAPQSHKGKGWEILTDRIISLLNEKNTPVVFLLWGGNARAKKALITNPHHLVLECAHPSPLSAYNGFFGCNHFARTNDFLAAKGLPAIDWTKTNE